MMELTIVQFTVGISLIVVIFTAITVLTWFYVRKIMKANSVYKAYTAVVKEELKRLEAINATNYEDAKFLYTLLMDICMCQNDSTVLYKTTNLRAILLLMNYNPEKEQHIAAILHHTQDQYINSTLHDMMVRHRGLDILEEETGTAYEKFMKTVDKFNKDRYAAQKSLDEARAAVHSADPTMVKVPDTYKKHVKEDVTIETTNRVDTSMFTN